MAKFLITGVSGFLGSRLANDLILKGHSVVGIGRSKSPERLQNLLLNDNFNYLQGEISEELLINLNNITFSGVFHLASQQPSNSNITFQDYFKSNVETTISLIKYFKSRRLDFFVYTSTVSIFGKMKDHIITEDSIPEPENFYSLTKFISEKLLKFESLNFNSKIIVIRLQSVFGNGDGYGIVNTFYKKLKLNEDVELFSKGLINRNLVHIDEVIQIINKISEHYNELENFDIFNVASDESLKTVDIALIMKDILKSNSTIICSDKKYIFDWDVFIDTSKAKKLIGFQPASMNEKISQYIKQIEDVL